MPYSHDAQGILVYRDGRMIATNAAQDTAQADIKALVDNANLGLTAKELLRQAHDIIEPHLVSLIRCHCLMDPKTLEPDLKTLDPEVRDEVEHMKEVQNRIMQILVNP